MIYINRSFLWPSFSTFRAFHAKNEIKQRLLVKSPFSRTEDRKKYLTSSPFFASVKNSLYPILKTEICPCRAYFALPKFVQVRGLVPNPELSYLGCRQGNLFPKNQLCLHYPRIIRDLSLILKKSKLASKENFSQKVLLGAKPIPFLPYPQKKRTSFGPGTPYSIFFPYPFPPFSHFVKKWQVKIKIVYKKQSPKIGTFGLFREKIPKNEKVFPEKSLF